MLEALVAGTSQASDLAQLAKGRMRAKIPELQRALAGCFRPHHQFMVAHHLAYIDATDEIVTQLSAEIAERLRPAEADVELLDAITGIGRPTAEVWLAEVGSDLERSPTHRHLASWAGMCPGNNESAGKRKRITGNSYRWNFCMYDSRRTDRPFSTVLHRSAGQDVRVSYSPGPVSGSVRSHDREAQRRRWRT
jgi:transposase